MTRRTIDHTNNIAHVVGQNGSQCVGFEFDEVVGTGKRRRTLAVDVKFLLQIADAIRASGRVDEGVGHAIYHLQNDKPIPCEQCGPKREGS